MKTTITSLLILLTLSLSAQWEKVNSGTSATLNSVYFPTENTGYAVGNNVILKSTDCGKTWIIKDSTNHNFKKVYFFNETVGLAIFGDKFFKTTDGGNSWFIKTYPAKLKISDISVINGKLFIVAKRRIYLTADTAESWTFLADLDSVFQISSSELNIFMINEQVGYLQGEYLTFNRIYKTTDGGIKWISIDFQSMNYVFPYTELLFKDSLHGFSGGWYAPHLMKTTNGGYTWDSINIDNENMPTTYFISTYDSVVFAGGPKIFRSDDLGKTWDEETMPDSLNIPSPHANGMNDLFIINRDTAIAVGYGGIILRYAVDRGPIKGIHERNPGKFKVYPNPSGDCINFEWPDDIKVSGITMTDMNGRKVLEVNNAVQSVNTSGFKSGQYFVTFYTNEGIITEKIIIEK